MRIELTEKLHKPNKPHNYMRIELTEHAASQTEQPALIKIHNYMRIKLTDQLHNNKDVVIV